VQHSSSRTYQLNKSNLMLVESLIELVTVLVEQLEEKSSFTLQVQGSMYEGGQLFQLFLFRRPIEDEDEMKDAEEKAGQSALK
jgi:hypothetical protein